MFSFFEQYLVIDYGSEQIKGVLFRNTPGQSKILRMESMPLISLDKDHGAGDAERREEGSTADEEYEEELNEYEFNIVRFITSFFPEEHNFIINVPLENLYVRDLKIPVTDPKQIPEVVPFEVENLIPIPMEEAEVIGHAWEIDEENSSVITFTAAHEILGGVAGPFLYGNTFLRMLAPDCVALSGMLHYLKPEEFEGRTIGQLDIGGDSTILNIVRNGELVFTRILRFGANDLRRIVAGELKGCPDRIGPDDFEPPFDLTDEKAKVDRFFLNDRITEKNYRAILSGLTEIVQELGEEIERSLLSHPETAPEVFYLSGGLSRLSGLKELLHRQLGIPVNDYPLLLSTEDDIGLWATALGTGAHYRLKAAERIDFLRSPFGSTLRSREISYAAFMTPAIFIGVSVVVFLAGYFTGIWVDNKRIDFYKGEINKIAEGISGLKAGSGTVALVNQARRLCRERVASVEMQTQSTSVLEMLADLTANFPPEDEMFFQLKKFRYKGNSIEIDAVVDNLEKVNRIKERMEESPLFSEVQATRWRKTVNNRMDVNYKLTVKETGDAVTGKCN